MKNPKTNKISTNNLGRETIIACFFLALTKALFESLNQSIKFFCLLNKITSLIISFIIKKNIRDSQCGFRMYRNSLFKNTSFREMGFQFESEFILKLGSNIKIKQVPIETTYNNKKSNISKTKDTIKFIKLIIRYLAYGK